MALKRCYDDSQMNASGRKLTLLILVLGFCITGSPQGPAAASCGENDQINGPKRQVIETVALNFVQTLLGSNPSAAYTLLSEPGKREAPNEEALKRAGDAIQHFKPVDVKIQHTYVVDIVGKSPGRVICGSNLSKPEGWVSVVAANVSEQAYVLLSAEAINNQFVFTVWLIPEAGAWKVQSFSTNAVTLADQGTDQLRERARVQKAKGHDFNAALLYSAVMQTTNRGPDFQLGMTDSIAKEASQLHLRSEIGGHPPFEWKASDMTFWVLNVGPVAVGGKIYVMIQDESPAWSTDAQIDGWNKKLIAYFKGRFPEYSDVFAGIVVRANEKGTHRGFGTVEEVPSAAK
jgi:hypothetical protein